MRLPLILFAAALAVLAADSPPQTPSSSLETQFDSLFSSVTQPNAPGLAVLVRNDGRTLFEKGYGVRDLRTHPNIASNTNFRLASFTKQFTATAVMLLVHDSKLRYDQTLTQIFPDFPAYGKNITIRHLLNHTGGLPDYEDLMEGVEAKRNSWVWTSERQIQDDQILKLLKLESKGKFAPGSSWSYSNSGYVVLGLVIAKVSGQPYAEFLRARIFAPLHMDHTIVYQKGKNEVSNRAFGHDGLRETDQSPTSATLGDGGIYSNLEDLAKWDAALRDHTLLSAEEMAPALVPARLADGSQAYWPAEANDDNLHPGKPVSYGFGWFLDPYKGHPRMWHTGSTMGFRTVIERFLADNVTIIILANRTDLDPESLSLKAANVLLHVEH